MTFSVSVKQDTYQTYILSDESAQSRLEVVPERGGIAVRWRVQGQELFYLDEERFQQPDKSVRGGIPILFPICGDIPDDTYTLDGKTYQLPRHGFARDLPWEVTESSSDTAAELTLVLRSSEQTHEHYPFDFQLAFTYRLQGSTLTLHQRYSNYSASPMPFSTGLHPYFAVGDKHELSFDIPAARVYDRANDSGGSYSGGFDVDLDEIDAALTGLARAEASFSDRSRNLKVTVRYSEPYETLVFWTVKDKPFICLEPWTAGRNAINTGEGLLHVEPGGTFETTVDFVVSSL